MPLPSSKGGRLGSRGIGSTRLLHKFGQVENSSSEKEKASSHGSEAEERRSSGKGGQGSSLVKGSSPRFEMCVPTTWLPSEMTESG